MKTPAAMVAVALLVSCGGRRDPLRVFNTVPDFVLTAQTGAEFHGSQLKGHIWVADFIFTTCTGPCPRMSRQMKQLQEAVDSMPEVRMVSFTVDPARDTPEVLAAYARRHGAAADRWFFLTGAQATLHQLARDAFLLGNVDGQLDHSTRFVLVDRRGRVRKYYDTSGALAIGELVADIRTLEKEPADDRS